MSHVITINFNHKLRKVIELTGPRVFDTGTTTIEAETTPAGDVLLYVQNKGFGKSSSKSVKTRLSDDVVRGLLEFFSEHLELSNKLRKMGATD